MLIKWCNIQYLNLDKVLVFPRNQVYVETRYILILANNSSSEQDKKQGTCAKLQWKLLKSMVVGTRQSFQFLRQNTWFLKNNRALPKFFIGFCIT